MTSSNNPTAVSAVVGEQLEIGRANPDAALVKQLIMPVLLIAFAGYLLFGIVTMRVPEGVAFPGPRFFPAIIAAGLALFAVLLIVRALRDRAAAVARAEQSAEEFELLTDEEIEAAETGSVKRVGVDWRSLAWIVGSFIGFAMLLSLLGWIVAAMLLFWCVARAFGSRRVAHNLVVGLTASSIAYIVFDMLLGLTLPSGILGWGF